jgi:hypothetical protein
VEVENTSKDVQDKMEAQSNLSSSLPRPSGLGVVKRTPNTHSDSIFDNPHIHGNIIS